MLPWILIAVVIAGGIYEAVALRWRIVPTITDLLSANWAVASLSIAGVCAAASWAIRHIAEAVGQ